VLGDEDEVSLGKLLDWGAGPGVCRAQGLVPAGHRARFLLWDKTRCLLWDRKKGSVGAHDRGVCRGTGLSAEYAFVVGKDQAFTLGRDQLSAWVNRDQMCAVDKK
jgi:hypothetical protein